MVGAMKKQTPSPGRGKRSVRTDTPKKFLRKEVIKQDYMCVGLEIAKCIDILVTASPFPIITLYTAAVPLSLWSLALAQALYFFPQLWSTLICDRFARRFNGITTYAATLVATAISSFITANALRTHSLFLYLLARFVNGLFRHVLSFGALAAREVPDASKGYDTKKNSIFSLMVAMLFGGVLGEYATDVATAIEILATMEFATAVTLLLLSFTCKHGTRSAPGGTSVEEYKNWLLRQPYRCISFLFLPLFVCLLHPWASVCILSLTVRCFSCTMFLLESTWQLLLPLRRLLLLF
ncbi:retrotransposon hot spot (RHS) protein, putative [Trypanosoma cruzi marinkellei]|uniref:Retrotransposon hot spot (RHS) protein, putative n=1 Tax=Trypanosoma cruzi marinkellei TaxID=85056 RepID=K2NND6_TRYCR|nr:retrotransposon hot spot (RHS) protein, putative [Trypanosoma cruzi marinkellei]